MNIKLKSIDSRLFFERFPQNFISDVRKQTNKEILHLSLKEIFERKELYLEEEHSYYYHNLKILRKEDINNNFTTKDPRYLGEYLDEILCNLYLEEKAYLVF